MRVVTCGMAAGEAQAWRIAVENEGEAWSVSHAASLPEALRRIRQGAQAVILGCGEDAGALIARLTEAPCTVMPYLACRGNPGVICDASGDDPAAVAAHLASLERSGCLPVLCQLPLPGLTCLARSLLAALSVRPTLRACAFLPDMLALCTSHPPLLDDLSGRLYPLTARRHGARPGTIERSLRLLVESTFTGSRLEVLERFFGHSVDPERGKPTNKEFLAQLQQHLTLADARIRRT